MLIRPLFIVTLWKFGAVTGGPAIADVTLNEAEVPYDVWHEMVLPGETLSYTMPAAYSLYLEDEQVAAGGSFDAPDEPGTYELEFRDKNGKVTNDIALFVLEPASEIGSDGRLNGYRIGKYPENEPEGFIRMGEGEGDINVSPNFQLGQFLCKQQPEHWPKYLLVSSSNLERLEILLASLNEDDVTDAETFFVMSGYRTPFYNTSIGSAKLSRHMYGDATDVYVDVKPRDGNMDDINRDGTVNKEDANFLYDYAEDLFASEDEAPRGGLGSYDANAVHGPFVHVDGRGHQARWGR